MDFSLQLLFTGIGIGAVYAVMARYVLQLGASPRVGGTPPFVPLLPPGDRQ
jgi:hypothetical protein